MSGSGSPGDVLLLTDQGGGRALLFLHFQFVEARPQLLHGSGAIFVLGTFALTADHDTGREMGDADCRVGLVDVLTTGTAGTVGVDPQILLVDVDLDIIGNLRENEH